MTEGYGVAEGEGEAFSNPSLRSRFNSFFSSRFSSFFSCLVNFSLGDGDVVEAFGEGVDLAVADGEADGIGSILRG
jgi:hypothetical protein